MQDDTAPVAPGGRKRGNPNMAEAAAKGRAKQVANREARKAKGERSTPIKSGTKAGISRDVRLQVLTALNFVGGVKYLAQQAKKNPAGFMSLLGKCLQQDDGSGEKNITFVIQQLAPSAAPVPGVLTSVNPAHIAPPLKLIANGHVIDPGPDDE